MAVQQMRTLQLDPSQVETAADFFEAYAIHIISQTAGQSPSETSLVDAASSFRSAGQWAMLYDTRRAVDLLSRAAEIWHNMGYGFGTFVLAAIAPSQLDWNEVVDRLLQIAQPYISNDAAERRGTRQMRMLEPLRHPQQQAYLLLASITEWRRRDFPHEIFRAVVNQSPHGRGVAPIGALGTPVRMYWDIARRLAESEDEESAAARVAEDLASMGTAYAQAINSAMANERLWYNAAAPVDVGDIDIAGIALIAAQRLGPEVMLLHLQSVVAGLDATARVPLDLAVEMINSESSNANSDRL